MLTLVKKTDFQSRNENIHPPGGWKIGFSRKCIETTVKLYTKLLCMEESRQFYRLGTLYKRNEKGETTSGNWSLEKKREKYVDESKNCRARGTSGGAASVSIH
jgi:hypothetical protein